MWFENNYMKLNEVKCHFLISGNTYEHMWVKVGDVLIWQSSKEKLLGVTIDKNLTFTEHVSTICKKAGRKVTTLYRLVKIMPFTFGCFRKLNRKINHIHERALRLVYDDYTFSFKDLLQKDGSVSVHHQNIHSIAIEMYKIKNKLSPKIVQTIFQQRDVSNLRSEKTF